MFGFSLPLAIPAMIESDAPSNARRDERPKSATQLYREVDRMVTTLVRSLELQGQERR
ncbi:MAG: hypothetical protein FJ095_10360 [Deltaproteobacteria bacterium]|nr:hypothetical protein [Deltaproteobacteria bacterium]